MWISISECDGVVASDDYHRNKFDKDLKRPNSNGNERDRKQLLRIICGRRESIDGRNYFPLVGIKRMLFSASSEMNFEHSLDEYFCRFVRSVGIFRWKIEGFSFFPFCFFLGNQNNICPETWTREIRWVKRAKDENSVTTKTHLTEMVHCYFGQTIFVFVWFDVGSLFSSESNVTVRIFIHTNTASIIPHKMEYRHFCDCPRDRYRQRKYPFRKPD